MGYTERVPGLLKVISNSIVPWRIAPIATLGCIVVVVYCSCRW